MSFLRFHRGPKRLNLGLQKKDVVKLSNESANKTTNGGDSTSDIISLKGFLNGLPDLDKPDLDLHAQKKTGKNFHAFQSISFQFEFGTSFVKV